MGNFEYDQKISSVLALLFVLVLGFMITWFSLAAADNIVKSAPDSKIFSPIGVTNELK